MSRLWWERGCNTLIDQAWSTSPAPRSGREAPARPGGGGVGGVAQTEWGLGGKSPLPSLGLTSPFLSVGQEDSL